MSREQQNVSETVWLTALNTAGAGVTGATITLSIKRKSDGQWWNGTAFQAGFVTVNMTQFDASNWPGEYRYDFNTSGLSDDVYFMRATTADTAIANKIWKGDLKVGGYVDFLDESILKVRKLTTNRLKVEITGDVTAYDDDSTTPIATGTVTPPPSEEKERSRLS